MTKIKKVQMKKLLFSIILGTVISTGSIAQVNKTAAKPAAKPVVKTAVAVSPMKNGVDSFSYAAGLNIATSMKEQGISQINGALLQRAIDDVLKNRKYLMTDEQANLTLQQQLQLYAQKRSAAETAKGKAFLASNKNRPGVITLPNGLQYEVVKAGDPAGIKPTIADTVIVNYKGTLVDGTEIDNSFTRGEPATFLLTQVIRGWTEIIQLMTKGAHWKVYIPSELGYGDMGKAPSVPPGATLIFDIVLEGVKTTPRQ